MATFLLLACQSSNGPSGPGPGGGSGSDGGGGGGGASAGVMAIALSPAAIWLGWEPVTGAASYRVERRTAGGDYSVIAEPAEPALLDTGLSAGTRYAYRIRALIGSEPGTGAEGETTTPVATPGPEEAARALVEATTVEEAMQATVSVLAAAGVAVAEGDHVVAAARAPAASWSVGVAVAANFAREASEREVSGRLTADELARMWADGGFPFHGLGTPGEQLVGFLQTWVGEAAAAPAAPASFVPLFLAAMAAKQAPSVSLGSGSAGAQDLRLSLLELEVLHATFDRSVQPLPEGNLRAGRSAAVTMVPECDVLKKGLGGKLAGQALKWVQGQLTDAALRKLGLSEAEMALFSSTIGTVFKALDFAMKIVNLIQLYANTQVMLSVGPPDPVHKPTKSDPRRLIEVTARAGIPDEAWARFIDSGSAAPSYRNAMACLRFLGAPLPSDAKDIADKVDTWRVAWDLPAGSPRHALVPIDVNTFDAASAGDPFGMKLHRDGPASAKAVLKVDITRESEWATLFDGPERQADVTVRAKVFTDSPPSPAIVLKALSFIGTLSALLDIGTEWFRRVFPPAATVPIHVRYREPPAALDASIDLSIRYLFGGGTPETSYDVTVAGQWSARLDYHDESFGSIEHVEFYAGQGTFTFDALTVVVPGQGAGGCEWHWTPVAGQLTGLVAPAQSVNRTLRPDRPGELRLGFTDPAIAPHENLVVVCPNAPPSSQRGFTLAYGGLQTHFDEAPPRTPEGKIPGMPMDQWVQAPDGALERPYGGARTVSWAVPPTPVLSETTLFRLRPLFSAAQP